MHHWQQRGWRSHLYSTLCVGPWLSIEGWEAVFRGRWNVRGCAVPINTINEICSKQRVEYLSITLLFLDSSEKRDEKVICSSVWYRYYLKFKIVAVYHVKIYRSTTDIRWNCRVFTGENCRTFNWCQAFFSITQQWLLHWNWNGGKILQDKHKCGHVGADNKGCCTTVLQCNRPKWQIPFLLWSWFINDWQNYDKYPCVS